MAAYVRGELSPEALGYIASCTPVNCSAACQTSACSCSAAMATWLSTISRFWTDSRVAAFGGGILSEIMKELVARALLGR